MLTVNLLIALQHVPKNFYLDASYVFICVQLKTLTLIKINYKKYVLYTCI